MPSLIKCALVPYYIRATATHPTKGTQTLTGEIDSSCEQIAFMQFEEYANDEGWIIQRPAECSTTNMNNL